MIGSPSQPSNASQGNLLGLLTAAFYVLFTLLPDSNSAMVEWPWVLFWQVGLLCPVLWFLGLFRQSRLIWLGNRLDWLIGVLLVSLLISTLLAPFPLPARWYSWAAICCLAALYALNSWLTTPQRRLWLLTAQGYLGLAFILVSLFLWSSQVLLPELSRLQTLQQYGVSLPFDFSRIELRNGSPIGHQNYVAGYLILILPLLLGLGINQRGWRRSLWFAGVALGLVTLYTTSSRGGWLGVAMLGMIGFGTLIWNSTLPRRWISITGIVGIGILAILVLANNRLRDLFTGILSGAGGGEIAYRLITITTGWQMGLDHLLTGAGPGNVLPLYQKYRPTWAGREAELHYQLHSTPAQLWAELGVWSVVIGIGAIGLFIYLSDRWFKNRPHSPSPIPPILIGCLMSSITVYFIFSLTDYQLDNLCISGVIIIYFTILATEFREAPLSSSQQGDQSSNKNGNQQEIFTSISKFQATITTKIPLLFFGGLGILVAILIWLIPIHRAWMLSSQGFIALNRKDINGFVQKLNQAHQLVPQEPYYAFQLGWNLGNLGLQIKEPEQQSMLQEAISSLQHGIQASPHQEFGYSNLAWLLLNRNPQASSQAFIHAAQLVPAKRGVFYGLGLSLVAQKKPDLAVEAIALETIRDPQFLTSPVWRLPELKPLYKQVATRTEAYYTHLLTTSQNSPLLVSQLHQFRGGLRWWLGDLVGARSDLTTYGPRVAQLVIDLADGKNIESRLAQLPPSASTLAIAAWLNATKRQELLLQAWIKATHVTPTAETIQELVATMNASSSFDEWLKQNAPTIQYRRERTGFGVLNRHTDGSAPVDFLTILDNVPLTSFFGNALVPSLNYMPEFDTELHSDKNHLLQQIRHQTGT